MLPWCARLTWHSRAHEPQRLRGLRPKHCAELEGLAVIQVLEDAAVGLEPDRRAGLPLQVSPSSDP